MSEPFLTEVRMIGFNFPPRGWAFCDGQILPISQNQSLYSLLGTTYGGDGRTTFALPDLRGRVPIHSGEGHQLGQKGGEATHTLSTGEMPQHTHAHQAVQVDAGTINPTGAMLGSAQVAAYTDPQTLVDLRSATVTAAGGGQAQENMQPYLTVPFVIALQGLFPSRN